MEGNGVWTLTRAPADVPDIHPGFPILVDKIHILDLATGSLLREIDILSIVMASE